jgi:hypothetical protein
MHFAADRNVCADQLAHAFTSTSLSCSRRSRSGAPTQLRIDLRKIEPVFSGTGFVKKFAQTVNVCARGARPFRRDVTFRSNE